MKSNFCALLAILLFGSTSFGGKIDAYNPCQNLIEATDIRLPGVVKEFITEPTLDSLKDMLKNILFYGIYEMGSSSKTLIGWESLRQLHSIPIDDVDPKLGAGIYLSIKSPFPRQSMNFFVITALPGGKPGSGITHSTIEAVKFRKHTLFIIMKRDAMIRAIDDENIYMGIEIGFSPLGRPNLIKLRSGSSLFSSPLWKTIDIVIPEKIEVHSIHGRITW